jgi:hypothetical protein
VEIQLNPNPKSPGRELGSIQSMPLPVETLLERNIVDKVTKDIQNWIIGLTKPKNELGRFATCPYAQFSKYQIEKRSISDLAPLAGVEVAIFVLEDSLTLEDLTEACRALNEAYPDYIFLDDHKDDHSFINGVQTNNGMYNLILCQNKEKLLKARDTLKTTKYYSYWDEEMYRRIVQG